MNLNEYQDYALVTAQYPGIGQNLVYPALKLAGEAGEAADKIGKWWRNGGKLQPLCGNDLTEEQKTAVIKELGDVLWYIAAISKELGVKLDDVARINIEKLTDRYNRGVIKSEGDER